MRTACILRHAYGMRTACVHSLHVNIYMYIFMYVKICMYECIYIDRCTSIIHLRQEQTTALAPHDPTRIFHSQICTRREEVRQFVSGYKLFALDTPSPPHSGVVEQIYKRGPLRLRTCSHLVDIRQVSSLFIVLYTRMMQHTHDAAH